MVVVNLQEQVWEDETISALVKQSSVDWLTYEEVRLMFLSSGEMIISDYHHRDYLPGPAPPFLPGIYFFIIDHYIDNHIWLDVDQPKRKYCVSERFKEGDDIGYTVAKLRMDQHNVFYKKTYHYREEYQNLPLVHYRIVEEEDDSI
ncbi:unnamed protein product [Cochlearia groenlandica]